MVKKALQGCTISLFGTNPKWEPSKQAKVAQWLTHLSGKYSAKLLPHVTHLVVSEKRWREDPRPAVLRQALEEKAKGRDLKIVNFDWLEDTLDAQSKKREAGYEWTKRDAEAAQQQAKKERAAGKGGARSVQGMMQEVFEESTAQYVDPAERRKLERKMEEDRERQRVEKEERIRRRKEQAKIFGRGAQKAKAQILSESHHIFQDDTGFKYDIQVTKVDTRHNRNERWGLTIQIFESNTQPHSYAVNTQHAGSSVTIANNLVSAIGTPFPTALHAFKSEFFTRTGVRWDERLSAHIKRQRQEKIDRGQGTGSVTGSVRGVPVSEAATREVPFEQRKFEYHPPGYGPKGDVGSEERKKLKDMGIELTQNNKSTLGKPAENQSDDVGGAKRKKVEDWMSGQEQSAATADDDIDFEKMMKEEGYPFEKPVPDIAAIEGTTEQPIDGFGGTAGSQNLETTDPVEQSTQVLDQGMTDIVPSSPTYDHQAAERGDGIDESFDWDGLRRQIENDPEWLDRELEEHARSQAEANGQADHQQQNVQGGQDVPSPHDSLDPQIPSFITHPTTGNSFQDGTQQIGETQVAEKAGGEFLEEFANGVPGSNDDYQQQRTPPSSTQKPSSLGQRMLGGLNLGSSILGKRKGAPTEDADCESVNKAAKT